MNQPVPRVSAADVERLLRREFPSSARAEASQLLAEYGTRNWHQEPHRVRAAMLKLAAGDLEKLRRALAVADQDYRDVLATAEYARCLTGSPADQSAIAQDWEEYRAWFARP